MKNEIYSSLSEGVLGRIDEISKGLAQRYFKKSVDKDKEDHDEYMDDKTSDDRRKEINKRAEKREKGMDRASKKLEESPSGIRPEGEKAFAARHKIEIVNHGVSNEVQHTAHDIAKDKTKKASYEDGQDTEAYHGHTPVNPSNLGIKGKLKEAADDSKYHADAAERHQKAAEAARADGKKMLAAQHEKKAAKHREIYKKHQDLKESAEQIDEISKDTAQRYVDANRKEGETTIDKYASAKGDEKKALSKKIDKRRAGLNRAMKKLQEDGNTFADVITEISAKVLGSYIKKASENATVKTGRSVHQSHAHDVDGEEKLARKATTRLAGVSRATDKLVKKAADSKFKKLTEEAVQPKNHSYGWIGTHKVSEKNHAEATKKWAPHIVKHLTDALKKHQSGDKHFEKVTGTTTTSAKVRAGIKVDHKMAAHFLDSTHGRHLAHHSVAGKEPTDPKVAAEIKQRASEFTRSYHPSHFDESTEVAEMTNILTEGEMTRHRVGVTVTDPNHPSVTRQKEKVQKTVRVSGIDKTDAVEAAKRHYKKQGYKVHDAWHIEHLKEGLEGACWKGYEAIGTKKKDGKEVPNCVPVNEEYKEGDAVKIHFPNNANHGKKGYIHQTGKGFHGVEDKNGKHMGYYHESDLKKLNEDISTKRADRKAVTTTKPDGTRETKWVRTSQRDIVKEAMELISEEKLIAEEYSSHDEATAALERHRKKFPSANLSITKGVSGKYHVMKHTSGGSSRVTG